MSRKVGLGAAARSRQRRAPLFFCGPPPALRPSVVWWSHRAVGSAPMLRLDSDQGYDCEKHHSKR